MKRNVRTLILALCLPAVLASLPALAEAATYHTQKTFPGKAGGAVKVEAAFQDVQVKFVSGQTVTVTVDLKISRWPQNAKDYLNQLKPVFNQDGDTLVIRSKAKSGFSFGWSQAKGTIAVQMPRGMDLQIATGSGDCMIKGDNAGRSISCRTGSGDIHFHGATGRFKVNTGSGDVSFESGAKADQVKIGTGSGDVRLRGEAADLAVTTGSGDVTAEGATGTTKVRTGSGDLQLRNFAGSLDVATGSGNVTAAWASAPSAAVVRASTGSGDVILAFPASTAVSGALETSSGGIHSSFPGTSGRDGREWTFSGKHGGAHLDIRTSSGDITIRKSS